MKSRNCAVSSTASNAGDDGNLYDPDCRPFRAVGSNLPNLLFHPGLRTNLEWMREHGMHWLRVIPTGHGQVNRPATQGVAPRGSPAPDDSPFLDLDRDRGIVDAERSRPVGALPQRCRQPARRQRERRHRASLPKIPVVVIARPDGGRPAEPCSLCSS